MVEGHSVHRVAASHRRRLVGKKFACTSPNGRFTEGAAAINNKNFRGIEAVGKNLFAWFGKGDDDDGLVVSSRGELASLELATDTDAASNAGNEVMPFKISAVAVSDVGSNWPSMSLDMALRRMAREWLLTITSRTNLHMTLNFSVGFGMFSGFFL